jgi:hypothetical protein
METIETNDLLKDIEGYINRLRLKLKTDLLVSTISNKAKLPFKAIWLKETLLYRIIDLSECSINLHNTNKIIPSFILIRATFETLALLFSLLNKIRLSIQNNNIGDIDDFLMKSIAGNRLNKFFENKPYDSINVLTLIDKLSNGIPAIRENYDILSEFAHPNSFGTINSYSIFYKEELKVELGFNKHNFPENAGITSLRANLLTFELFIIELDDLFPSFTKLCEDELSKK